MRISPSDAHSGILRARPARCRSLCSRPHESLGPDGGRADVARRARVRHLLAPAQRADHLPRHPGDDEDIANLIVAPAASTWSPRTRTRTSRSTSTRRAARSTPGLAIYDAMQFIKPDVSTICVGVAMSMGALLLAGGARGQADGAAQLEDPDPPGLGRLLAARRRTSRSTPRRSSTSASGSTRSSPSTPASRLEKVAQGHRARLLHERGGGEGVQASSTA